MVREVISAIAFVSLKLVRPRSLELSVHLPDCRPASLNPEKEVSCLPLPVRQPDTPFELQ
jgi:hypothetical protein